MRTCGSHQIMGPTTVKMAKTGFMGKIAKLQLEVPYFDRMVQKCACEKSYISIIITFITQASLKYLQEHGTFLAPQNHTQGRCDGGNISIFFTKFSPLFQASLYVGELKSFQGIEDIVVRRMKMR